MRTRHVISWLVLSTAVARGATSAWWFLLKGMGSELDSNGLSWTYVRCCNWTLALLFTNNAPLACRSCTHRRCYYRALCMDVTAYWQLASCPEKPASAFGSRCRFLWWSSTFLQTVLVFWASSENCSLLLASDASTSTKSIVSIEFWACDHLLDFFVIFFAARDYTALLSWRVLCAECAVTSMAYALCVEVDVLGLSLYICSCFRARAPILDPACIYIFLIPVIMQWVCQ